MTSTKSSGDWSSGAGLLPGRATLGPLFLMVVTPPFAIVYFHVVSQLDGDFLRLGYRFLQEGVIPTLYEIWPSPWDATAWTMIGCFMGFQLLLMKLLPGKTFVATVTPKGNHPTYTLS
jgi:7-dehydrocholesterol reductase